MDTASDRLLEPCDAYRNGYKEEFHNKADFLFDELLQKANIPVEENRKAAADYRKADTEAKTLGHRVSVWNGWKVFFIILAVIAGIVGVLGVADSSVGMAILGFLLCLGLILLVLLVFRPKIKALKELFATAQERAKKLYDLALSLLSPLFDLFDTAMTTDLIQKTVPTLVFDRNFDMRRFDYLNGKYGYQEDDGEETSSVGLLSGEIIGNPFVFERKLHHYMGNHTYHGSLTIHWTTTDIVNGKTETRHHSQTLTASVTKPKPCFQYYTDLVYGNEAAPDLSFSHKGTHAEKMNEKQLKSFVKKQTKKIQKKAEEEVAQGFTELGNEEFDAVFGALDRDHEVQFRMLFTPLAQKNLLALMKGDSPYGDDFDMYKKKCINVVKSEHAQKWEPNIDTRIYHSYDVDLCRALFLKFNDDYFCSVFFDLAPLLSIPMYQQIKPREYIYHKSYERFYTVRETEVAVNRIGFKALAHPSSVTPAILKTSLLRSSKGVDTVNVNAFSYRTVRRVDYVPVHGGDGYMHDVPVPWLLYIPLHQDTEVELKGLEMTEYEYRHSSYAEDDDRHGFFHSIFTTLGRVADCEDEHPEEKDADLSGVEDLSGIL